MNKDKITADGSINWGEVSKNLNWIDLMSFDQHGEFDAADGGSGKALSMTEIKELEVAIKSYIDAVVPAKKIILGIPAYAREMIVKDVPTASNNFGYNESLKYTNIDQVFNAFKQNYYDSGKYQYAYNANPDAYNPAGGMVDFKGSYNYSCFVNLVSGGAEQSTCSVNNSSLDNREIWELSYLQVLSLLI
ncbi:hypothetical protein CDV26_11160 [Francisella halioticida]|uniref:chitinase n=1 Tax=Francisella halioticida TaxID=549298 RepID=A0ABN5AYU2_9GAMM|nr:hypothetical protein CDV26_11160 [Francisella halioticida]